MLEAPYTPRVDTQVVTDNAMIDMVTRALGAVPPRPSRWERDLANSER